jgi:3-oxoacyl-[acyl-carrier-protein] synthase-3
MLPIQRDVAILGSGRALPKHQLTNDGLRPLVTNYDSSSGDFSLWVDRVTHIQSRYWIDPTVESAGSLGTEAARNAVESSGVDPAEIDHLIFCSFTYNNLFPGEHVKLLKDLGIDCGAFQMTAACAGSLYGLVLATSLVRSGQCRNVLVVGTECLSRCTDPADPITAILFGDAAGAMVVGRKDPAAPGGLLPRAVLRTEYNPEAISMTNANCPLPSAFVDGDYRREHRPMLRMEGGPRVLRSAVTRMADATVECLGFTSQDLKDGNPALREILDRARLVPHQANGRIVDGLQEKLGISRDRVYRTIYFAGNTSAASNPFTYDFAAREGNLDRVEPAEGSGRMGEVRPCGRRLQKGDLVLMPSIGAGYSFGAVVLEQAF